MLGPASLWAVLAAGIAVLMLVLCFAEAGSLFEKAGGAYVYTREAFGDFVAFEVGWMTCIARVSSGGGLLRTAFARRHRWSVSVPGGAGADSAIALALAGLTAINVAASSRARARR